MVALVLNLGPEAKNSAFEHVYGERRNLMSIYKRSPFFFILQKKTDWTVAGVGGGQ